MSAACDAIDAIFTSCSNAVPSFTAIPVASRAKCYCYSSQVWQPAAYDSNYGSCLKYLITADPTDFSTYTNVVTTPCASIGNVLSLPTATAAPVTPPGLLACNSVIAEQSACNAATPGFSTIYFPTAAKCLCYSGGNWQPSVYDGNFGACVGYLKTADPTDYSSLLGTGNSILTTPCALAGNILAASTAAATSANPATTAVGGSNGTAAASSTAAGTAGLAGCSSVVALQSACNVATPGFSTLPASSAARCLCYSGTSWRPATYDNYYSTCLGYLSTAYPTIYSSYTGADGKVISTPCANVGDVLALATTSTPSSSTSKPTSAPTPSTTAQTGGVVTVTASPTTTKSGAAKFKGNKWLLSLVGLSCAMLVLG